MKAEHPYHPIIYVRGFAATQERDRRHGGGPLHGVNIGSTKTRLAWTGEMKRFYFESPLVRLMGDREYEDVFVDGDDLLAAERSAHPDPLPLHHHLSLLRRSFGGFRRDREGREEKSPADPAHRALREGA